MGKIIYILSDVRSGSTLLDQLLGAHPRTASLGEVNNLKAYALQDRSIYNPAHPLDCSCGKSFATCEFWSAAEKTLGRPFAELKLMPDLTGHAGRLLRKYPRLFRLLICIWRRVGHDSFDLYDVVFDSSKADYLVDSSKNPFRFRTIYNAGPSRVIPLVLTRDYRAVVHSKMKRGASMKGGMYGWVSRMRQIAVMTADIPATIHVSYEDLCRDPRAELERIFTAIGLPFSEDCLSRPEVSHHIGGSPSKFDPAKRQIRLDDKYLSAFTDSELAVMRTIAGPIATDFGYNLRD
jgi:hypothetical protein